MTASLPEQFSMLEPLAEDWAFATENERNEKREKSSREELRAFYDEMLPHIENILDYLDTFPLGELPEPEQRLLYLALSLAHAGLFVEVYRGQTYVPHAFEERRFVCDAGDRPIAFKQPA